MIINLGVTQLLLRIKRKKPMINALQLLKQSTVSSGIASDIIIRFAKKSWSLFAPEITWALRA